MSFNFGAPTTTTVAGFAFNSTTTFGTPQAGATAFGAPQTSTPAFGTPQAGVPSFGATGTAQSTPGFGATQSTPAFGAQSTPAFGTTQPTPAFGATQATPAFGATPQATPAFGATPQATPAFGATQATPAFGATQATPSFGFGTTTTQPQTGFGATSLGAATTTTTSFGFAPVTTQPPAFGGFGLTTTTQPTLPTFGATTTPATTTTAATLTFTPLSKPNVTFGATTTTTGTIPTFGLGTTATTTAGSSGTGFNFTAPTGQLSFGAAPVTTSTTATGGGLFGLKTTTGLTFNATTTTGAFGTTNVATTSSAMAPKIGLGGLDVSTSQPKTVEGRSESVRAKDSQLPQEILCTVEMLKSHIKQQKTMSSNIARTSTRKLFNVSKELQNCDLKLSEISNYVANNYAAIKSLRSETAGAIRQAEMAQRTHETPPGLQFENTAPLKYFLELVQKFENDMITFRNQVTLTEKHIRSLTNPQGFSTAQDLKKGLHEMHETFVTLTGRVYETHQKVQELKEQYLNLRKHKLKDSSNVFEEKQTTSSNKSSSIGPTPFSTLAGTNLSYIPNQVHKSN